MEGYGNENPGAFQPTRPLRGATIANIIRTTIRKISTHAPLAGRDLRPLTLTEQLYISTHAPLAGRDIMDWFGDTFFIISTHAPLAGRDSLPWQPILYELIFQPTRPLRGATSGSYTGNCAILDFNPRAPCGARRRLTPYRSCIAMISTHAPLAGRDPLFGL